MTHPDTILSIGLLGASGRMGQEVISALTTQENLTRYALTAAWVHDECPKRDTVVQGAPLVLYKTVEEWFSSPHAGKKIDVVIDFSQPEATKKILPSIKERKIPILICTTGDFSDIETEIDSIAQTVPVARITNTSLGIYTLRQVSKLAAQLFTNNVDIEISETHHRYKKDAPSGTALTLANDVATVLQSQGQSGKIVGGDRNELREPGTIGMAVVRGGDNPGEHTVLFLGESEELHLEYRCRDRAVYARGAIDLASRLAKKKAKAVFDIGDLMS